MSASQIMSSITIQRSGVKIMRYFDQIDGWEKRSLTAVGSLSHLVLDTACASAEISP